MINLLNSRIGLYTKSVPPAPFQRKKCEQERRKARTPCILLFSLLFSRPTEPKLKGCSVPGEARPTGISLTFTAAARSRALRIRVACAVNRRPSCTHTHTHTREKKSIPCPVPPCTELPKTWYSPDPFRLSRPQVDSLRRAA